MSDRTSCSHCGQAIYIDDVYCPHCMLKVWAWCGLLKIELTSREVNDVIYALRRTATNMGHPDDIERLRKLSVEITAQKTAIIKERNNEVR